MTTESGGYARIPANDDIACPKCRAENIGRKIAVWLISDERGPGHECDVCAHYWKTPEQAAYRRSPIRMIGTAV